MDMEACIARAVELQREMESLKVNVMGEDERAALAFERNEAVIRQKACTMLMGQGSVRSRRQLWED